jgi:elongation factor P--(R)-beta-lysine ligase
MIRFMTHIHHIAKNKELLEIRSHITRAIREFFWEEGFLEVETPAILRVPGQEPYLSPMKIDIHNEKNEAFSSYLHTSPEYTMKKMLAGGFENIFYLGKCFRDNESFGGLHNPEFTMLEWYRVNVDFYKIMDDIESLMQFVTKNVECGMLNIETQIFHIPPSTFKKIHMRDLWQEHVDVNLDEYLTNESMLELCVELGHMSRDTCLVPREERYEDLFYRIFLNHIEPKLIHPTIVHHYPSQMAALAKLSNDDPRYAERFEVYINGVEIANAFTELTDTDEQLRRLKDEQALRKSLGKDVYDIDMEFIDAVKQLPSCAGIALGVDRLVQVLTGCKNIDDVLVLPASKQCETSEFPRRG